MTTPEHVSRLIETFDRNIDAYRSGRYTEANVRTEFIDPFFKALGWDIRNEQGRAEAYKALPLKRIKTLILECFLGGRKTNIQGEFENNCNRHRVNCR